MYGGALKRHIEIHVDGILIACPTAVTDVEVITETVITIHRQYKQLWKAIHYGVPGGNECREAIMKPRDKGIPAYLHLSRR